MFRTRSEAGKIWRRGVISTRLAIIMAVTQSPAVGFSAISPVSSMETETYLERLSPLPHKIAIASRWGGAPQDVVVITDKNADDVTQNAAAEIRQRIAALSGAAPSGSAFKIVIGTVDAEGKVVGRAVQRTAALKAAPNSEQAYAIEPVGKDALLIYGLTGKGAYYGAVTLNQLMDAKSGGGALTIPLANVLDWPDMSERGTWNASAGTPGHIAWLAAMKLNFEHFSWPLDMNPKAERCPPLPMARIEEARKRAFLLLPHSSHYDFFRSDIVWAGKLGKTVNKDYFPAELVGKGDSARNPMSVKRPGYQVEGRCPCASNPLLEKYLTEWMMSAAKQGVREVSMWLTEYQPCYCSCEKCLAPDGRLRQIQLETAATVRAIRETRKSYPDFVGRILLTLQPTWHLPADYWSKTVYRPADGYKIESEECLAAIPDGEGVKVEKMYGSNPTFNAYAKSGRWLAVYHGSFLLGIDWWWRGACPFRFQDGAKAMRDSVRAWLAAGYAGSRPAACIGDAGMEKAMAGYTLGMLAEWSWNSTGRSERQFVRSWLVRQGYADVDKALAYMDILASIEPIAVSQLKQLTALTDAIRNRSVPKLAGPGFEGMTAETADARFDALIASARKAADLADEINAPDLRAEADYVVAALEVSREVYRLALKASRPGVSADDIVKIRAAFQNLALAAARSLDTWKVLPPNGKARFAKLARTYSDTQIAAIADAVKNQKP